ncbi:hypothetical protein JHK82_043453 [Glycine max]|nr:hypothetical protein JHK82_043453 [Glycine max]
MNLCMVKFFDSIVNSTRVVSKASSALVVVLSVIASNVMKDDPLVAEKMNQQENWDFDFWIGSFILNFTALNTYFLIVLCWRSQAMSLKVEQIDGSHFYNAVVEGFCDHTQWKYAVFWKLDHHFPMNLTWENGYQKRDEVEESMWGDLSLKSPDELYSSNGENADYSARLLMIEMSHHKYSLGEGVVGKIALSRDHCWVSYEDILTGRFDTDLIPECPDEWLLQFACGIKTIVLVPVLPLGVLQFGSFEAVAEDKEFVTNIMDKFHFTHHLEANITPLNLGTDCQDLSFSDLMHNLMDSLDESYSVTKSILKTEVSTSTAALNSNVSRLNPTMLSFIQDDCCFSRENLLKSLKIENEIGSSSSEMPTVPRHIDKKQLGGIETGHDAKNVNDFAFPSESEFCKALGSVSYGETGKFMSKCISVEETYSNSTLVSYNHANRVYSSIQPENYSEESTLIVDSSDVKNDLMPAIMSYAACGGPKLSSSSKKRTRVGNNQKSRPRDRQLIMDRMKELRELVPEGGRVPECKRQKVNASHPGRSCAFDFESQLSWPIVIEDLECSGHMLIEMICNEHGLFLEIAQVIRKLDVTILKGILENRSSNSWACFIVEVPRGFHRMDVLCPLLHLLQLRRNPVSCKS